ncbi:MAG: UDP-N-acetylmuramoyl-L-alanine--D-glutamate ligase [Gammaproteobacteria bacterium]|nr:MAG: UDP-N-acetylmuramoyl-L-alanine--D-glutamate ligase [Gammaproteobacteria bacterium]
MGKNRPSQPDPGLAGVLVLGMGATGASLARYLARRGETAEFVDSRDTPPGRAAIRAALPDARLYAAESYALGDHIRKVFVSPGFPLDSPLYELVRARGLPVSSDIDLFMTEARAPVVGITGSNGKSTVTAMLASALSAAGWQVRAGGNLGTPALDLLDPLAEAYLLELSSFQLERSGDLPLAAAAVLNLSPDHLDSHTDFAAYAAAKARIYRRCRHAVLNRAQPALREHIPVGTAVTSFGLDAPDTDDFGLRRSGAREYLACGAALLMPVDELPLPGRHNVANALAALALGAALDAGPQAMLDGLRGFRGLPHRMQLVGDWQGIRFIDDSKATNVDAAVAGVSGISGPLVLIAGGDAKGAGFEPLAEALRAADTRAVVLLGRDRERLAAALTGVAELSLVDDMQAAVRQAAAQLPGGGTVLLAPACSSLDMYPGFAARGEAFRQAVEALKA